MEKLFLSPAETANALVEIGKAKVELPVHKMLIMGGLAGAYIAIAAELATMVTHDMSAYVGLGFASFVGGSVFSGGLMLVIIAGSELFTGNCLIPVSVLAGEARWGPMLKNWIFVYIGNLLGSLFLVALMTGTSLWEVNGGLVGCKAIAVAYNKVHLSFTGALCRGVGCNWLVCLAVMFAVSARTTEGKIWGIYFPIMAFVASGFEHSVANMYFIPAGIAAKANGLARAAFLNARPGADLSSLNWMTFTWRNLLPVTLGNIIGGALLVGTVYWYLYVREARRGEAAV